MQLYGAESGKKKTPDTDSWDVDLVLEWTGVICGGFTCFFYRKKCFYWCCCFQKQVLESNQANMRLISAVLFQPPCSTSRWRSGKRDRGGRKRWWAFALRGRRNTCTKKTPKKPHRYSHFANSFNFPDEHGDVVFFSSVCFSSVWSPLTCVCVLPLPPPAPSV